MGACKVRIRVGEPTKFEEALGQGLREMKTRAPGLLDLEFHKGLESPYRHMMIIRREPVDAQMDGYREGPLALEYRAIVAPFFAQPARRRTHHAGRNVVCEIVTGPTSLEV